MFLSSQARRRRERLRLDVFGFASPTIVPVGLSTIQLSSNEWLNRVPLLPCIRRLAGFLRDTCESSVVRHANDIVSDNVRMLSEMERLRYETYLSSDCCSGRCEGPLNNYLRQIELASGAGLGRYSFAEPSSNLRSGEDLRWRFAKLRLRQLSTSTTSNLVSTSWCLKMILVNKRDMCT